MEKLLRKIQETKRALKTLKEILEEPYSIIVRDATIQRFEYTFESFWKMLKEYLKEYEGILCNSPKSCFREAFRIGLLQEEEVLTSLKMANDRNLTSHTYIEEVAQTIYTKIEDYYSLMAHVVEEIEKRIKNE